MDSKKSPAADHILDTIDDNDDHQFSDDSRDDDMAVAVAQVPQPFAPPPGSQSLQQPAMQSSSPAANKRYRPAPAKTFQCRGYGECRMVFSRSEHLARHIRYASCFHPIHRAIRGRRPPATLPVITIPVQLRLRSRRRARMYFSTGCSLRNVPVVRRIPRPWLPMSHPPPFHLSLFVAAASSSRRCVPSLSLPTVFHGP